MKNPNNHKTKEVRFRLDDAAILAVLTKLAAQPSAEFSVAETAALAALRRAHPTAGQSNEELGQWLSEMNQSQLSGVVSNTKGVLHEMLFVQLENADGDAVFASQFARTNNPDFDIIFTDHDSSQSWVAQLKATESESYVREWLAEHPNDQIVVTSEIAARMGLSSSGISNADLTADSNSLVSLLINTHENDDIWDFLPGLSTLSMAMVIWKLRARVSNGEITEQQFRWMAAKASGGKAARVVAISGLLSIPGINVLTGIALLAKVLESSGVLERVDRWVSIKSTQMERTRDFELAVHSEQLAIEGATKMAKQDRETDEMLEARGEMFRQIYEKKHAELKSLLRESERSASLPLTYENPEVFLPGPVGHEEIDRLVREKISHHQRKRESYLQEARTFLADYNNEKYFNQSLEKLVGRVSAGLIRAAIS
jgi:uncharacterized protein YidB (DUF937 family)